MRVLLDESVGVDVANRALRALATQIRLHRGRYSVGVWLDARSDSDDEDEDDGGGSFGVVSASPVDLHEGFWPLVMHLLTQLSSDTQQVSISLLV